MGAVIEHYISESSDVREIMAVRTRLHRIALSIMSEPAPVDSSEPIVESSGPVLFYLNLSNHRGPKS